MGYDDIIQVQGEVISPSQRIAELEDEISHLRGGGGGTLAKLLENPSQLRGLFALDVKQSENVKALLVGGGTGASVKFFGKHIGDELAAVTGALLSAYIAKKMFGNSL